MKKDQLEKMAECLTKSKSYGKVFDALFARGGYDAGRVFPVDLYKGGVQKTLQGHWYNPIPSAFILDDRNYNFNASEAGREWAYHLRVRAPRDVVIRVSPTGSNASTDEALLQLLGSLIRAWVVTVPEVFGKASSLNKTNFEALVGYEFPQAFTAGLEILDALPMPALRESASMLVIVDGLDFTCARDSSGTIGRFRDVLENTVIARGGRVLYTIHRAKKRLSA
ncbi:hypothetical protein F5Y16DRAFT_402491 [Xylariaceae sp. FL0255]|nr:hypothetical protein F5Y16DRAFT_402491 [Xylariaceae sp. FL0255]